MNPFRAAFPAALEGPANAIHGIGARRTAKVHWTFGSGSPWRLEGSIPAAYTPGNRSHNPLFVFFVQDFRHEGLTKIEKTEKGVVPGFPPVDETI